MDSIRQSWSAGGGMLAAGGKLLEWSGWGPPPGQGPALVLLHEGLGCVALWRDFPARLAQATGLPVFAWSRSGYGGSDPADLPRPLDYMTREATEVLPQVLDAVGAPRLVLLGHSDGATIASEYAGRVRDPRLAGLVLIAPHFFTEPQGLAEIARARDAYPDLRERMTKYHRDPDHAFFGWNDAWLHADFAAWNVTDAIAGWQVPALLLQGAEDQYGTAAQLAEAERRSRLPVSVRLIPGCRHAPHLERPEAVLAAVTAFLADLAA